MDKNQQELVSICVPIFNRQNLLVESINSIQNQTYQNIEIILVDNNSTDRSYELILENFSNIKNITIYKNNENIGYNQNFNKCIDLAKGKYIGIFHSDDIYDKDIVKKSIELISSNEKIGLVCSYGERINIDGEITGKFDIPRQLLKKKKLNFDFEEVFLTMLETGNVITTSTVISKKKVYQEIGNFDISLEASADYDLWLRILRKYKLGVVNEKLVKWREHKEQVSEYTIRDWSNEPPEFKVYEKFSKYLDDSKIKYLSLYKSKRLIYNSIYLNSNKEFLLSSRILKQTSNLDLSFKSRLIKFLLTICNKINLPVYLLLINAIKFFNDFKNKFFYLDYWHIGIINSNIKFLFKNNKINSSDIRFLNQVKNKKYSFLADPFFFNNGDDLLIVAEKFNYLIGNGSISFYKFKNNKMTFLKDIKKENNFHYSYPYTFIDNNRKFIIPECFQKNNISLLEINNNLDIIKENILIQNFKGVDTSVIKNENKYWLFSTEHSSSSKTDLHIWYSDSLFGKWYPCTNNPVKSSTIGTRGAGRIFYFDNNLYRPTQNNTNSYGGSIIINKIIKLNKNEFIEKQEFEVLPPIGYAGVHNIDIAEGKILLDLKLKKFMVFAIFLKIYQRIKLYI